MGSRKRAKPNPKGDDEQQSAHDATGSDEASDADKDPSASESNVSTHKAPVAAQFLPGNDSSSTSRSWYGGTWPRIPKATPVTQVDHESISASTPEKGRAAQAFVTPDGNRTAPQNMTRSKSPRKIPSIYNLGLGTATSNRSSPVAATTTKLNITNTGSEEPQHPTAEPTPEASKPDNKEPPKQTSEEEGKDDSKSASVQEPPKIQTPAPNATSWLDWLPRASPLVQDKTAEEPNQNTKPEKAASDPGDARARESTVVPPPEDKAVDSTTNADGNAWFGLWGSRPEHVLTPRAKAEKAEDPSKARASANAPTQPDTAKPTGDTPTKDAAPQPSDPNSSWVPSKSSAWAFWSKDGGASSNASNASGGDRGEVAVAGTASQSHPEAATVNESKAKLDGDASKPSKRGRPLSLENADDMTRQSSTSAKSSPSHSPSRQTTKNLASAAKEQLQKVSPPNLVLPPFHSTYHLLENPSIIQQIARLLQYGKQSPTKHVNLVKDPPRIKRALAIGVHGYFPVQLIRTVLGQPTGTSIRFANYAADAIRKWTESRGYECEIEKVALEGEGKIAERVDTLWKLMLNWIDKIQRADFVLVACHSQGVPVGLMLVAKLIEFGCISAARVGVCAMAGVNLGPFPDYNSRLFSGSAGELFEFSDPDSMVSKRYEDAMSIAVKHGVRILYVGSIDDQLVSLESSTFSTVDHPYIYRAVFVDGRVHAPDFITHLVGFALKLRNLGISDHGLIRELSAPLAGSLYTGEGHSRVYDDSVVYDLAVEHALETTSVGDIPLHMSRYKVPTNTNPFILPWSMRGLLEEEYVRTELDKETTTLLEQFDNWKPTSKVLKDVKFRLEAVKSKL